MTTSQRSLAKGSAAPGPVPEGVIRIYGMRFCPYVQRAILVLVAKGIKHEVVNINLKNKPDWFFEKSPLGLVPSIETSDDKIIYESLIICDYLDEAFPGVKLTPADPYEKAQQKILLEHFNAVRILAFNILLARTKNEDYSELKTKVFEKFKPFEEALTKRNIPYLGGESLSMIDYMIWPWFERLHVSDITEVLEKMPRINAWYKLMLQDPAVKQTFIHPDVISGFTRLYFEDNVDAADYGLD
ncbi:glutathione S-transferase omega-1-like [Bufo gargarizans]|uniref:glutathione S-transferase omega-1-like n=1 Tax=Bufo gargarizans TaxID=30331 RepID=UPI001CF2CE69|nr:glutathione S-transferase omega-1-like [Bufo gargarizans]XP_044154974.1 glutathione S-transferase omega-1-like [Bufo gargarizans]